MIDLEDPKVQHETQSDHAAGYNLGVSGSGVQ